MPRYRFQWSSLPDGVLNAVAEHLQIDGDPAETLRARYGAKPKETFIADVWPVLLHQWLSDDAPARTQVIEQLRSRGLGDCTIRVSTREGALRYLASCRNSKSLREVVLAAFLELGEGAPRPAKTETTLTRPLPPPEPTRRKIPEVPSRPQTTGPSLGAWLQAVISQCTGANVEPDADGDLVIARGSSVTFVRALEGDIPVVQLSSCVVAGVPSSPSVYQALNEINVQVPLVKATHRGDSIMFNADIPAATINPDELMFALNVVSSAADFFDDRLRERFGGNVMLDDDRDAVEV